MVVVGVRRGDEGVISFDVQGTALDCLPETDHLVVAGFNSITVVTVGANSKAWLKIRTNRQFVKKLKFNPLKSECFACVSGQFVDVYALGHSQNVQRFASFSAQSRNLADFCWCPFDESLMVCCAEGDSVSFWDVRDTRKPSATLNLLFGASQAKFSPHLNNYLLTAHGSGLRLWDLRHTSQPISTFSDGQHDPRVLCVEWHPHAQEPNSFLASTNDGFLRLWDLTDRKSSECCEPRVIVGAAASVGSGGSQQFSVGNVWRMTFSHDGEELATISLPSAALAATENSVTVFGNATLDNPQPLKNSSQDIIMDVGWQKSTQKSSNKYLFTLSKKHRLCRHPVAYEISNELRDEMATPIVQTGIDEERDRLIADDPIGGGILLDDPFFLLNRQQSSAVTVGSDEADGGTLPSTQPSTAGSGGCGAFPRADLDAAAVSNDRPSTLNQPIVNVPLHTIGRDSGTGGAKTMAAMSLAAGNTTPQSPIFSDWHRWIKAPAVAGGDLLTELEAIRKHSTEGLYTTEVNFQRAAIGFSYMHVNRFRKINFEMRFHRNFIDNGLVFVEVLQKDSPFTADKATLFLMLLQQESDEQVKQQSVSGQQQTVLFHVLLQLPKIVESMKVFTASVDVPCAGAQKTATTNSSLSGSASEDPAILTAIATTDSSLTYDATQQLKLNTAATATAILPVTYVPSAYDHLVPAPRNCGARFNGAGFLVTFGRVNYALPRSSRARKTSLGGGDHSVVVVNEGVIRQRTTAHSKRTSAGNDSDGGMAQGDAAEIPRVVGDLRSGRRPGSSRTGTFRAFAIQPQTLATAPRSLADYCVLVNPQLYAQQMAMSHYGSSSMSASATAQSISSSRHRSSLAHAPSATSGGELQKSPPSSSAASTMVAREHERSYKHQPSASSSGGTSSSDTTVVAAGRTTTNSSLSPPGLSTIMANQPLVIGASSGPLHRNDSVKSTTTKAGSPSHGSGTASNATTATTASATSGTIRSYSLQNVSQSLRHRGNSMSAAGSDSVARAGVTSGITSGTGGAGEYIAAATIASTSMTAAAVMPETSFSTTVFVYDVSGLLPVSKQLAAAYKLLGGSALDLCRHNLAQAAKTSRKDLVVLWRLLEQCVRAPDHNAIHSKFAPTTANGTKRPSNSAGGQCSPSVIDTMFGAGGNERVPFVSAGKTRSTTECFESPWSIHPFGRELINNLLDHYSRMFDIQTSAVITCVLGQRIGRRPLPRPRFAAAAASNANSARRPITHSAAALHPSTTSSFGQTLRKRLEPLAGQSHLALANSNGTLAGQQQQFSVVITTTRLAHQHQQRDSDEFSLTGDGFATVLQRTPEFVAGGGAVDSGDDPMAISVAEESAPAASSRKSSRAMAQPLPPITTSEPSTSYLSTQAQIQGPGISVSDYSSGGTLKVKPYQQQQFGDGPPCMNIDGGSFDDGGEDAGAEFFLDPALANRFEDVRTQYADLLYRWRMYKKCAEVLKYCSSKDEVVGFISSISWCEHCGKLLKQSFKCQNCRRAPVYCAICEEPCYGTTVTCTVCSHGGHLNHMARWFYSQSSCPVGCGCDCKL